MYICNAYFVYMNHEGVLILYIGERNPALGSSQYYYGHFRYHVHHPWPKKTLSSAVPIMKKIDMEDRSSVCATMAKATGYTGLSILHRLNHLYGFNILLDTVYDAMHNIPLNVVSHHLHYYFNEMIISPQVVEEKLKAMPWTPGMHSSFYKMIVACNFDLHMYMLYK